jgi:hypothetical protein
MCLHRMPPEDFYHCIECHLTKVFYMMKYAILPQTDSPPPYSKCHCIQHIPSHYDVHFHDKIIACPVPECPVWTIESNIMQNHLCNDIPLMYSNLLESNAKYVNNVIDSAFCKIILFNDRILSDVIP